MKVSTANEVRTKVTKTIMTHFVEASEDCGMIANNSFNFPFVHEGEEGWIEVVVKIPKEYADEGYDKREAYRLLCEERAAKKEAKAAAKAKKQKKQKQQTDDGEEA